MVRFLALLLLAGTTGEAAYKAGVARVNITPEHPIWMSGYASRNHPSEGALQPIWAKALAIEDEKGTRVVIVTTDLIGLPHAISDEIAARAEKQYGLDRSRLLLNSSHTHTGPVVGSNLHTMFSFDEQQANTVKEYSRKLVDDVVVVIGEALKDLSPAHVYYGSGETGFAVNRREKIPNGVRLGVNPGGPVDHSVPVLKITKPDGSVRALLFGYACHNTTLTGEFYQISGDYAGAAQEAVEKAQPGVTAMFLMLCGADQNPNPRSKLEYAQQHGKALAAEVSRVATAPMDEVKGQIRTALRMTELDLAPHTRETFEAMKSDASVYKRRLAEEMLRQYDARRPVRRVPYPVQAIRFGGDHVILALGGEVVVGYALRAKREFRHVKLIVAGYSNDVMCYIPTEEVLKEGGYEAVDSMTYYGQPGPFAPGVEQDIFDSVRLVMKRVGLQGR
jgi:hypothetical protein